MYFYTSINSAYLLREYVTSCDGFFELAIHSNLMISLIDWQLNDDITGTEGKL